MTDWSIHVIVLHISQGEYLESPGDAGPIDVGDGPLQQADQIMADVALGSRPACHPPLQRCDTHVAPLTEIRQCDPLAIGSTKAVPCRVRKGQGSGSKNPIQGLDYVLSQDKGEVVKTKYILAAGWRVIQWRSDWL